MKPTFGLELVNHRYSSPQHLKGNKLSLHCLNRTTKMKLKKVQEIKTARSEIELYIPKRQHQEPEDEPGVHFFQTHSKILRGRPFTKGKIDIESSELSIKPAQKEEKKKIEKPRPFYRSANLEEKMNIYLNSLISRSEEDHKLKLKEITEKIEQELPMRKTTYNTRHLFWKKMRKFVVGKGSPPKKESYSARANSTTKDF